MEPPNSRSGQVWLAPGTHSSAELHFPGRDARLPAVDDHIVRPDSPWEVLDGELVKVMGALPPHATEHTEIAYLFRAHVAAGYRCAVDMLTRTDEESNFAPDVSIYPDEPDPETGGRALEEVAFEVVAEQSMSVATRKARKLSARGVRRVFCVKVDDARVMEWKGGDESWTSLASASVIEDRCLSRPLAVLALVDAAAADDAVVEALLARKNRALVRLLAEGEARGEARGRLTTKADAVFAVLEARGLSVDGDARGRIAACDDAPQLDRWLVRAITVASVGGLFQGDEG